MATRIYQGEIRSVQVQDGSNNNSSSFDAICDTNNLFHDAVNYHLIALAGMAANADNKIHQDFRAQVSSLYSIGRDDGIGGESLRASITRTLCMRSDSSFEQVVDEIFKGISNRDVLPYVFQYIIDRTEKGEGVIQQEGRGLLPKLCDVAFKGNFDYSIKEKKATIGKARLQMELSRDDISELELQQLAYEMDLSWAGIKTQPDDNHENSLCYPENEVMQQVKSTMDELCVTLSKNTDKSWQKISDKLGGINLYKEVKGIVDNGPLHMRPLAKNNKAVAVLKQAAIFFMFYPYKLSAEMLKAKIGASKETRKQCLYDYTQLENDPLIMARGIRSYVYKGFTALPCWETIDGKMCSSEFDILAFKEALKIMHGFVLKTEERKTEVEKIEAEIAYVEEGKGKMIYSVDEEEESQMPVLGKDPRFEALKKLVKEISPDDVTEYHISSRTMQGFEQLSKTWLAMEASGVCDTSSLVKKVREQQAIGERFGSQLLFEMLCQEEYRIIWHDWTDNQFPRSKNMLRDFSVWQALHVKKRQYERPVRVSAADPVSSPRQLMYSDMSSKECKFVSGKQEKIQVSVAVRNERLRWVFAPALLEFSAPRFERDEMGRDTGAWCEAKKNTDSVSWLQPMTKALELPDDLSKLTRTPAVALYVKYKKKEEGVEPHFYLNFPVSLDLEPLQKAVGKSDIWKGQFLGGTGEKLHLHWPGTYKAAGKVAPWWENKVLKKNGFDVLGVDLGMRSAFAWSLVHVSPNEDKTEQSGRLIGNDGHTDWMGAVKKQGVARLDGERSREVRGQEVPAVALPSLEDVELVKKIHQFAQFDSQSIDSMSLPELFKSALKSFQRLLSRTRTLQSFLAKLHSGEDSENCLDAVGEYFSYGNQQRNIVCACKENDVEKVKELLFEEVLTLRANLPVMAVNVTNLLLPRKRMHWQWIAKSIPGWQGAGQMVLSKGNDTPKRRVYHRGGISIDRITQLEKLRQRLQSMSKILSCSPCEKVPFGRDLKDTKVIDPCPEILEKLENMKEQRVNLVAHEIVAQALGVRLKKSKNQQNQGGRDVWHGEYERIPNRVPVDFVVMENLKGYQTNIDRTPYENSTLMRWSHRQITAKVVQLLQEVFGIPVLFTHASYTSRFDSMYSSPGFRPELITPKALLNMGMSTSENEKALSKVYETLYKQLQNSPYKAKISLIKPHHKNGGEMFLSECCGKLILRNADVNAATNIVWRGIAAPEAIHLLHRVRMEKQKGRLSLCWKNEREKALKGKWSLKLHHTELASESNLISTFFASPDVEQLSFAIFGDEHSHVALSHGKLLWGVLKQRHWELCHRYNIMLLHKAGIDTSPLEKLLFKERKEKGQDSDDIPM